MCNSTNASFLESSAALLHLSAAVASIFAFAKQSFSNRSRSHALCLALNRALFKVSSTAFSALSNPSCSFFASDTVSSSFRTFFCNISNCSLETPASGNTPSFLSNFLLKQFTRKACCKIVSFVRFSASVFCFNNSSAFCFCECAPALNAFMVCNLRDFSFASSRALVASRSAMSCAFVAVFKIFSNSFLFTSRSACFSVAVCFFRSSFDRCVSVSMCDSFCASKRFAWSRRVCFVNDNFSFAKCATSEACFSALFWYSHCFFVSFNLFFSISRVSSLFVCIRFVFSHSPSLVLRRFSCSKRFG
mmetsp:Transcript_8419/g.27599  ORF Transcript_8419/g.27599 Transcript_8419/m.27599 type:complete len:304 (-) Transcript_8419:1593-2504(-)